MFQLTPEQIFTLGLVASGLIVFFRLVYEVAAQKKFIVPDWVMVVIVYLVSLSAAILWFPQALPSLPILVAGDPVAAVAAMLAFIGSALTALTAYAAAATVVYLLLLQKIKDGLGKKFASKAYKTE